MRPRTFMICENVNQSIIKSPFSTGAGKVQILSKTSHVTHSTSEQRSFNNHMHHLVFPSSLHLGILGALSPNLANGNK